MLEQLWTFVLTQIQNNQFLAGGFVLGTIAAVLHWCKEVPGRIWRWVKSQFVIEVDIPDKDEAFWWLNKWLALHPYGAKQARLLTVKTERPDQVQRVSYVGEPKDDSNRPEIIMSPAAGHHWFWFKGRMVMLERNRKDSEGKDAGLAAAPSPFNRESFIIKMFTRDRKHIVELLEEARELIHPKGEKRVSILACRYGEWVTTAKRRPRPLASVVLRAGVMESIISCLTKFLTSEQWYIDRGIPWRFGVLLKGPPGSGKSSAAIALASHFNLDIAILNLNAGGLSDDELRHLLADVPKNTLVLIEDIDCVFDQREANDDKESKVTFSGLLNAIDGVAAGEGRVLLMTTNHPEKLDPALIRPGRADARIDIGPPDAGQASRMFERFFPASTSSQNLRFIEALKLSQTSMAAIQGHLTKYSDDAETAIARASETVIGPEQPLTVVSEAA